MEMAMKTPEYYPFSNKSFHQWEDFFSKTNGMASLFFRPLQLWLAFLIFLGQPQFSLAQLPVDPHVVHGNAVIDMVGEHMTITNSPDTIINWQEFSIGNNNSIHFQQPDADSQVLNRVTGNDPSQIFGSLSSNGGVWLINPHGVLFGENARIDVGGLTASTLDISNLDFLAHNYQFNAVENGSGSVVNQGEIRTSLGGRVWMTGEQVQNEGLIQSPEGNIVLAAGENIELIDSGAPNVTVLVSAPENETVNLGSMIAANGQVDVHGSIVNQQGIIRVDSITTDESGHIVLTATNALTLSGRVDASNPQGQGGKIEVTADTVELSQAAINAGGIHGGTIHLGGGWQGSGDLPHAREVTIDADSKVAASGKIGGGEIAVWSTKSSKHYGSLEAKDGGRIEFSSKGVIRHYGDIDVGSDGHVLFDPKNLGISSMGMGMGIEIEAATFDSNPDEDSIISTGTINLLLGSGTDVTLQANNDITISTQIDINPPVPSISGGGTNPAIIDSNLTNLTLQAGRNITFEANINIDEDIEGINLTAIAGHRGAIPDFRGQGKPTLTINKEVTLDVGAGTAVLAAIDGDFINSNGDAAISTTEGRWLIYSANPDDTSEGFSRILQNELQYQKHYNQPYTGFTPAYADSENWFLYSVVPAALKVAPGNPVNITYGDSDNAKDLDFTANISGYIDGDSLDTAGITGSANWDPEESSLSSSRNRPVGSYDVAYTNGLTSTLGYQFEDDETSNNELSVNPKPIDVEISVEEKTYDATTQVPPEKISKSLPGVITGDKVFLNEVNGTFADSNVGLNNQPVPVIISLSNQPLAGQDASNYILSSTSAPPIFTEALINPKPLTVIANPTISVIGIPDLNLTGRVNDSDFVDGESENVFTAPPQWTTSATSESFPGAYPVTGTIFARNYTAIQAPGNATALTIDPINTCCEDQSIQDINTSITGTELYTDILPPGTTVWVTPPWRVYGKLSELYYDSGQPEVAALFGKLAVNAISPLSSLVNLEDKIRTHERLASILIEKERFAEARFYALPMLKRLEYKHFTGNRSTGMFPKKIPETPAESKYVQPAQKLVMEVISKSKKYWLLNEKKLKGQQLTNQQEKLYNLLDSYYKKLGISAANPIDVTGLAENVKKILDYIELFHGNKISGKPLTNHQVTLDSVIKEIHPTASAEFSNISNDIGSVMAEAGIQFPTEDMDYIRNISENLERLKYGHKDHVVLLFYLVTDEKLSILLFPPDQINPVVVHEVSISRSVLNGHIEDFRAYLTEPGIYDVSINTKIYNLLIKPIRAVLDEFKLQHESQPLTLALLKTGALRYIPFSALKDGDRYLIEDFAITTYIEAKTSLEKIVSHNASIPWSIVALGVSESRDKKFTDLRYVEDELDYIVLLTSAGDIRDNSVAGKGILPGRKYLNLDFTRRQLKSAANDHARVLHLASHFQLETSSANSFLLAGDGSHITLEELREFDMSDKELVALSACNTALSRFLDAPASSGKEVESMALTLFEHSKPHAVLASLWEIADQSTATFMKQFYLLRKDNKLSKAEAIRQAQLFFINGQAGDDKTSQDKRRDPYYWAPFILMGNWR